MRKVKVEPGSRYGKWTVISEAESDIRGQARYLCRCLCGKERIVVSVSLRLGGSLQCMSCARRQLKVTTGHGLCDTRAYSSWQHMKERCQSPGSHAWKWYGGRGIKVCERWQEFEPFYADMGECPAGKSIDRIDHNGNYEPANCRWATQMEQIHNRRPTSEWAPRRPDDGRLKASRQAKAASVDKGRIEAISS